MGSPKVEIEISAQSRGLAAKLREARAKFAAFGAELKQNGSKLGAALNEEMLGKDLAKGGFWGKGGAQMLGNLGSAALGGITSFAADQARDVWEFNDGLTRLQITAGATPAFMQGLARSFRATSNATGLSAAKVLEAAQGYVALTGDIAGAAKSSDEWARVAQATNSSVSDISATAAAMKQNLKIDPSDSEAAFSALAVQGKEGAIELKDLAAQLSSIAPQWAMFKGGTGLQGLKELGASLQVVKRGFGGDAGETVTGLQSMLTALVKHAPQLAKAHIRIFDKDPTTGAKTMRNVLDIVNDIGNSKLAQDPTKLEKAFGRVEAYRAYLQLSQNKDMLAELIDKAGDTSVIGRDLQTYVTSPAGRAKVAWERVKNAFGEAMTPERLETLAAGIEKLAGLVGGMVDRFAKLLDAMKEARDFARGSEEQGSDLAKWGDGKSADEKEARATVLEAEAKKQPFAEQGAGLETVADSWFGKYVLGSSAPALRGAGAELGNSKELQAAAKLRAEAAEQRSYEAKQLKIREASPNPLVNPNPLSAVAIASDQGMKEVAGLLKEISAKLGATQVTTVKVGADAVATAAKNAPQHGTRPSK